MSPSMSSAPPFRLRHRRIPGPPPDLIKARSCGSTWLSLDVRASALVAGQIGLTRSPWVRSSPTHRVGPTPPRDRRLRSRRLLDPTRLAAVSIDDARAGHRRPALTGSRRAGHDFTMWLLEPLRRALERLRREPLASLRRELLDVPGSAGDVDAILLYAAGRPVFGRRTRTPGASWLAIVSSARGPATRRRAHSSSSPAVRSPRSSTKLHALLVAVGKSPLPHGAALEACRARRSSGRRPAT